MANFKQIVDTNGALISIQRLSDNAHIPIDPANRDYAEYHAWVSAGGIPDAPPVPTLDELKALKAADVDAKVDAMFQAGFPVPSGSMAGEVLQIRNNTDRTNWLTSQAAYSMAVASGQGATLGAVFRTTSNTTFTLTFSEGLGVLLNMAAWGQSVYGCSWTLKDAIKDAADLDALDALDLTQGWPA